MLLRHDGFRRLCRARELLGQLDGPQPNIEALAREVRISPYHFIRQFKALFGVTPHQYRVCGFVALDSRFGDFGGTLAAFAGAEAGLVFKQRFYLGVRGAALTTPNHSLPGAGGASAEVMWMGYGGFMAGYGFPVGRFAKARLDVLTGRGQLEVSSGGARSAPTVLVLEPTIGIDVRFTSFSRNRQATPIMSQTAARRVPQARYRFRGDSS